MKKRKPSKAHMYEHYKDYPYQRDYPQFRDIILSKAQIDQFLKQPEPMRLMALYSFYYYLAVVQETNKPHANNTYVAEQLKCSIPTVIKYRKQLKEIGLIKSKVKNYDGKTCQYVEVVFYRSNTKYEALMKKYKKLKSKYVRLKQ